MAHTTTIYALSSGNTPSGVAIIRVSGPDVVNLLLTMIDAIPAPREAVLRKIYHPVSRETLDEGLVLYFKGPSSFTGEDCAEFHCHGGPAVVRAILEAIGTQSGLRIAEAGEFSRRAFENGRLDLTSLEGLSDLVASETDAQRRLAVTQAGGALRDLYDGWRYALVRMRALIEAELDFADEDDVPGSVSDSVWREAALLANEIDEHLSDNRRGEIIREGFRVVLYGAPNTGKSSLLNALAKRDVAIVADEAGTTRDLLEVKLDIGGYSVIVTDTAGIRDAEGAVEAEGIRRAKNTLALADLVLLLQSPDIEYSVDLPPALDCPVLPVWTKNDIQAAPDDQLAVSTLEGSGLTDLLTTVKDHVSRRVSPNSSTTPLTRARYREALLDCVDYIRQCSNSSLSIELKAESLRLASDRIGKITGRVDVEDLLDVIFFEFCIGK